MRYRFGEYVLDTDLVELRMGEDSVHLEPQVFAVLAYLVVHNDRVISKEELLDEIWGTRFVTESALTSRIKAARRAVGDDGQTQDTIRTLRGHGYRFVAPIRIEEPDRGAATATRPNIRSESPTPVRPLTSGGLPLFDDVLRGREDELREVGALVDAHAVVTLIGPGGTGKTRLAAEIVRPFDDDRRVVFVDLTAVRDPDAVAEHLAVILGIQLGQRADVLTACCEYLGPVPHVLVIDNCEHVSAAAAKLVQAIVGGSPDSKILATSREPLGLSNEHLYRVGELSCLPGDGDVTGESVSQSPSGALFADRARRLDHRFAITDDNAPSVAELCRALDGLPLAIELAAGLLPSLSLDDLLARLDRRLDLLRARHLAGDDRHRTLRATVEWSYDALGVEAQQLLRHLAVFPAGSDLETVEYVASRLELIADPLELVTSLVDASLLQRKETDPGARYTQLETLRSFGYDRLEHHEELGHALDVASEWALDLVSRMDAQLLTPAEPEWSQRVRQELPNLRVARQHLADHRRLDDLVQLATRLHEWSRLRGGSETWSWADDLLELIPPDDHHRARVCAIASLGAWRRGAFERTRQLAEQALDAEGTGPDDPWTRARALSELGVAVLFSGDIEGAVDLWLARTKIDPSPIDLGNAAFATAYSGDIAAARRLAADARAQADESGSLTCIAWTAYATGEIEHVAGSGDQVAWLEMAVEHATVVGSDFTVGVAQLSLATTEAAAGAVADAAATYHSLIEHWLRSGTWTQQWTTLRNVATLLEDSAPATALALIVGADRDEFSPALTPTAEEECRRLRDRLVLALGPDRAQAAEIEGKRASRTELADAARVALRLLMAEAERSELPQDSHR